MIIWFASGNIHKKKELADILAANLPAANLPGVKPPLEVRIPSEAGLEFDPDENGNTFTENALIKAEALRGLLEKTRPPLYKSGDPVIADDSGICVDALGGRPGIHSARYSGPDTAAGAGKQLRAEEKNALLLGELGGNPRRNARFICAMVLYYGPNRFYTALESMEGELIGLGEEGRGKGGFGYDPILYIPELGRTVAELSDEEKNRHSHRARAGRAIAKLLSGE